MAGVQIVGASLPVASLLFKNIPMTECSDERNSFGLFGASVWKDGFSVGIKGVRVASCESFLTIIMCGFVWGWNCTC